jgi:hypothetical protein
MDNFHLLLLKILFVISGTRFIYFIHQFHIYFFLYLIFYYLILFFLICFYYLFFNFLAFIFIFLLIKYLIREDIYALTASFVYVCAPYLTICRLIRGAYCEFFAMCLLPPTLFFILRYINKFSIKYLFFSVFFLFLLLNKHLITLFYFLLFSLFFLFCQFILLLKYYWQTNKSFFLRKFGKRFLLLSSILFFSILISSWSFFPIILYKNLSIKSFFLIDTLFRYKELTSILSLFSLSDVSPNFYTQYKYFKLKTGFLLNISLLLFILIGYKSKLNYFFSILITQLFILILIIYPFS